MLSNLRYGTINIFLHLSYFFDQAALAMLDLESPDALRKDLVHLLKRLLLGFLEQQEGVDE